MNHKLLISPDIFPIAFIAVIGVFLAETDVNSLVQWGFVSPSDDVHDVGGSWHFRGNLKMIGECLDDLLCRKIRENKLKKRGCAPKLFRFLPVELHRVEALREDHGKLLFSLRVILQR